jgi:hypothetical protein
MEIVRNCQGEGYEVILSVSPEQGWFVEVQENGKCSTQCGPLSKRKAQAIFAMACRATSYVRACVAVHNNKAPKLDDGKLSDGAYGEAWVPMMGTKSAPGRVRWASNESLKAIRMSVNLELDIDHAISRLKTLHNGDAGFVEVVACGKRAIPALREVLFEREPSGLFQTRCLAAEALARLGAYDVLIEYLSKAHIAGDPVEKLGNDAVINAAALAVAKRGDDQVFQLLLRLAERPSLTGVVGALASFERAEAIPRLIEALEDDASRPTAEAALKKMGQNARTALIAAAKLQLPSPEFESESNLRRRRSALRLLKEIGIAQRMWPQLRSLMQDADYRSSAIACQICLISAPASEKRDAVDRLVRLLANADWMLRDEIEDCLAANFEDAREIITRHLQVNALIGADAAVMSSTVRALLRIQERAGEQPDLQPTSVETNRKWQ